MGVGEALFEFRLLRGVGRAAEDGVVVRERVGTDIVRHFGESLDGAVVAQAATDKKEAEAGVETAKELGDREIEMDVAVVSVGGVVFRLVEEALGGVVEVAVELEEVAGTRRERTRPSLRSLLPRSGVVRREYSRPRALSNHLRYLVFVYFHPVICKGEGPLAHFHHAILNPPRGRFRWFSPPSRRLLPIHKRPDDPEAADQFQDARHPAGIFQIHCIPECPWNFRHRITSVDDLQIAAPVTGVRFERLHAYFIPKPWCPKCDQPPSLLGAFLMKLGKGKRRYRASERVTCEDHLAEAI